MPSAGIPTCTAAAAIGGGIPRQVTCVGGAATSGVGGSTSITSGASNQQLLSALACLLGGGAGPPGSIASNSNMPQPQLPDLNAVDADIIRRTLLAQRVQQQQQAALAKLLQTGGGGGGLPRLLNQGTGALPSPTRAAPPAIDPGIVLTLLEQLQRGSQQPQQMPQQVPGPLPSAQVMQTISNQHQLVASAFSPPQPPSAPAPVIVQAGTPTIPAAILAGVNPGSILALFQGQQPGPQHHRQAVPAAFVDPRPQTAQSATTSNGRSGDALNAAPSVPAIAPVAPSSTAPPNNSNLGSTLTLLQQLQQQSQPLAQRESRQPAHGPSRPAPSVYALLQAMMDQRR